MERDEGAGTAPGDEGGGRYAPQVPPDSPGRPTRKRAGNGERFRKRESEVIEAATRVFFRRGYAAASIQDVADEVGVLKGSLYYYIDSKEDLLARIFDESHRQAGAIIDELSAADASPLERIRLFVERYVTWYLRHFERTTLYFNEWRHLTGEHRTRALAQRRAYDEFVRTMITAAQAAGEVDPDLSPKYASFLIHGAVNAVSNWYRRGGDDTPEEIAAVYGAMVTRLLRSEAPRPKTKRGART